MKVYESSAKTGKSSANLPAHYHPLDADRYAIKYARRMYFDLVAYFN